MSDDIDLEFRAAVERYSAMVYSIALRISRDAPAAEEIAQDAFLELHRSWGRLGSGEHIERWLRRVATHRTLDWLRRRATDPGRGAMEYDDADVSGEARRDIPLGLQSRMESYVSSLPEVQRTVIVLRYQEGLAPEEIAETLRLPLGTVKSQLQRALKLLRRKAEGALKEYVRG